MTWSKPTTSRPRQPKAPSPSPSGCSLAIPTALGETVRLLALVAYVRIWT